MAKKSIKVGLKTYNISYEIINPQAEISILILHGWGANKQIMKKAFCNVFDDFKQIYIDLPGFGESEIFYPLNTKDYANIVKNFINTLPKYPDIVLGHSFGGKIATLLEPKILVLLSSSGIVVKKRLWIRFKIALFKLLKPFGFSKFYRFFASKDVSGMSRVMYETLKNVVDENFYQNYKNLECKTLIFWGKNDKATPLTSGQTIHQIVRDSKFYPLEGDHFFFLLHANFIANEIKNELKSESEKNDN